MDLELDRVGSTLAAVQTTARQAIMTYGRTAPPEAFRDLWNACFVRSTPQHRLTLVYVANEVIRQEHSSSAGGGHLLLTQCLAPLFPPTFAALVRDRPDFRPKLDRILAMWRDSGQLNDAHLLNEISRSLGLEPPQPPPPSSSSVNAAGGDEEEEEVGGGEEAAAADPMSSLSSPVPVHREDEGDGGVRLVDEREAWMLRFPASSSSSSNTNDLALTEAEQQVLADVRTLDEQAMDLDMGLEPQSRNALKLYQVLVSSTGNRAALADEIKQGVPHVGQFAAQEEEQQRERGGGEAAGEEYERVETAEPIRLDCTELRANAAQRRERLQEHLDQAERTLVGLVELLDGVVVAGGDEDTDAGDAEISLLTRQIDSWEDVLSTKLEPMLRNAREKRRLAEQQAEQQAASKRARTSRWGSEAPPPLPQIWAGAGAPPAGGAPAGMLPPPFQAAGGAPPPPLPLPMLHAAAPFLPGPFMGAPPPPHQHYGGHLPPPPQYGGHPQPGYFAPPPQYGAPPPPPAGYQHHPYQGQPPPPPHQQHQPPPPPPYHHQYRPF